MTAVIAVVVGDMMGSGIFFTPGELASVATARWQVYFFWSLAGVITLSGALTLAELSSRIPRAGASYHVIREGFGPFWAFLKIWIEIGVSGPGSVASVAIVFGEFLGLFVNGSPVVWGALSITFFATINLLGVRWGSRAQILLTSAKLAGVLGLVVGGVFLAEPARTAALDTSTGGGGVVSFIRLVGLGVAAVLFTYDGWVDVSHVAGEVDRPKRNLPLGLGLGVGGIIVLYLLVNYAFLRVVPLETMRESPRTVAAAVAVAAFGALGGELLSGLLVLSIFGALGGLVMTLPRLYYAAACEYEPATVGRPGHFLFKGLAALDPRTAVPSGSILACAALSLAALFFFGSFSRLVTFFVVPLHFANILMVASVFRLRRRPQWTEDGYLTPGYPVVPVIYIAVIAAFLASAVVYNVRDTLIGIALTATGVPVYAVVTARGDK